MAAPVGQTHITQCCVDPAPRPREGPPAEQGIDGLVRREVGRQGPLGDPAADQVEDRVQDQAPIHFSGLPPGPPVLPAAGSSGASAPTALGHPLTGVEVPPRGMITTPAMSRA